MAAEHKRVLALVVFLMIALAAVIWQTTGTLRSRDEVRAYDLTPPTAFAAGAEPTIIDPAKLGAPLVPDDAFTGLLAAARADFQLVGGLRVQNRAALVERMGSEARADRVIGLLAPDAANLAGAQVELISIEISEYSESGAVVNVFASYQLASLAPAYRTFSLAYAPEGESYRLDGVSTTATEDREEE